MDFQKIRAGMTGSEFIDVFNENVDLDKSQLEALAASIILRVIANNVKEIKSEGDTLYFTVDGDNWISTNTNVWGDIEGDISKQPDLMELFNSKANASDLNNTNSLLGTTRESLSNLTQTVNTNKSNIDRNSKYIGTLQQLLGSAISSQDIKGFRLSISDGVLQYTTDNVVWKNVISTEYIDWTDIGKLEEGGTSDPRSNPDLDAIFTGIENIIRNHINDEDNPHHVNLDNLGLPENLSELVDIEIPITEYVGDVITLLEELLRASIDAKLSKQEDEIESIEYLTAEEYYSKRDNNELSSTTIYIVN